MTTHPEGLTRLIEELEKATEPSWQLDADIQVIAHPQKSLFNGVPKYTSSLDAAMTLVPEGNYDQSWTKSTRGKGTWEHWTLYQVRIALETVEEDEDETSPEAIGCHNVLAIALCIAALKARAEKTS